MNITLDLILKESDMTEIQMALTPNFVWLATEDTDGDYLEFKQLKPEKVIKTDEEEMEYFFCTVFKGYHWNTLGFRTKGIYDLYRVFDRWELILETADVIVELPEWYKPTDTMEVRAYERLDNNRLLLLWQWWWNGDIIERKESDSYKLSVVVPCYKAELFMCRTMDSILSNTLDSIELIIVNDGSPENDLEIAKRYADNYPCVKVIDKPNTWLCDTRNKWMDLATWEYLAFCDADDIIHPFMYEILFNACKKENTDIAISNVLIRTEQNKNEWNYKIQNDAVYTFDEMMEKKNTKDNIYFVAVWNKIVKTEVAKKVWFITKYIWKSFVYEDIAYTWSLYSYIDKFAYCKDAIYTWEKRKRNTVWTVSTWHRKEDTVEYSWETFIYWASYPLYYKSWNHLERHDYTHFKRLIESYKKFTTPSPLLDYRNLKLKELINNQKLYDNKLIMGDSELSTVINRLR